MESGIIMGFFDNIDWNKVAEKGLGMAQKAGEAMERKQEEMIRTFRGKLRSMSDQQIRNGLRNIDSSDWRYSYIEEEARRRSL